jgi:hypothetical protein
MYLYRIPNVDMGQYVDSKGYVNVDETAPIIRYKCFHGEVNEDYESAWATDGRDFRFGNTTNPFPYRYFISTLRALQMQCTYIHTTGHLLPQMLPFLALELGRTVEDAPDVWSFLNTFYLKTGDYSSNDWQTPKRTITEAEIAGGIEAKNFERWLYQRDAVGYETKPEEKIQQAIKMWMVQPDKYYDYIARSGKKIGFDIDARWPGLNQQIAIKVTYFDKKAGTLNLVYNDGVKQQQKSQTLLGDNKLKTATFIVPKMVLNTLPNNFDFALEAGPTTENIVVSMVRVVKATENSGPTSSNRNSFDNAGDIKISYNKANNKISVNSRNNIRQIEVYDILGKKVRSLKGDGTGFELQTGGLKPGIYLVQVNDTTGNRKCEKIAIV